MKYKPGWTPEPVWVRIDVLCLIITKKVIIFLGSVKNGRSIIERQYTYCEVE
jgi:hypothetical protein